MKTIIELIYSVFIGVAVALFIGSGVWAIYPGPQAPTYPETSYYKDTYSHFDQQGNLTEEGRKAQQEEGERYAEHDRKSRQYEKDLKSYHRMVAVLVLAPAAVSFALGIWLLKRNPVVGEGLAFGGIISSIYALSKAWSSNHRIVVFAVVSALLVMSLVLVLVKFGSTQQKKTTR